ncbi:MAG: elongation factor P [Rickettsia sp.]|nr:elongation factor P [Rickettsia sp.]
MKIIANDLRLGHIIEFQNSLWSISKNPEHIKPGKGGAYVQVEMKNLYDMKKLNHRFNSHHSIDRAYIEERKLQYLYDLDDNITFLDNSNLEEVILKKHSSKNIVKFLLPNIIFTARVFENKIIDIIPPINIIFTIKETEIYMKSFRESPSYKIAITENDVKIMVPSYINVGDKVSVNTEDMKFIEKL